MKEELFRPIFVPDVFREAVSVLEAWRRLREVRDSGLAAQLGGAAANVREAAEGLEVRPKRMRENLDATRGMLLAENVTTAASEKLGRLKAHDLVEAACRRALVEGRHLREELLRDAGIRGVLSEGEIDDALDPAGYLGSAGVFVDRASKLYREEERP